MMSGRSTSFACGVACIAFAAGLRAQQQPSAQQPPTFKSGTQVVEVDVRVFDKDGHFVTNLKPEDFEIKEDGAVQPITTATLVGGEPGTLNANQNPNANPNPGTANRTTEPPNPRTPEPQVAPATWLFVFDTPHLSLNGIHYTQKAVADFIGARFHQGDLGGVVIEGKMANNRLTSDREELLAAVDAMTLTGESGSFDRFMHDDWPRIQDEHEAWMIADLNDAASVTVATQRACNDRPEACEGFADPSQPVKSKARQVLDESTVRAASSLRVINALCSGLAKMAGPKTIVYFSDGFLVTGQESTMREVTGLANRAGAHFYTVDARGLNHGTASSAILTAAAPMKPLGAPPQFEWNDDSTNALAVDTGGIPIRNDNNFGRALEQIQADAGTYYVIGYTPSNQAFDGKYRKIDVAVKRPGVKVRARRGYLALEPAKLLKPTPIVTTVPPASAARVPTPQPGNPASAPPDLSVATVVTPSPAAAPLETVLRTRMSGGALVSSLKGDDTAPPDDPASLGWAAYQKGDVDAAKRELTRAAEAPDVHPWVHYVLGLCHMALKEYPAAAQSWERVRSSAPAFEPVYFDLADAYSLQSDRRNALSVLDAAAKRWSKDAEIFDAEGVIQIHAGALADAIASFERATKLAPKDPLGLFNLASAHHAAALRLRELYTNRQAQLRETQDDQRLLRSSPGAGMVNQTFGHRNAAIQAYRRVVALKGEYVEQAKKGLGALGAK